MSTPRQRRRFARIVILTLIVAWIVMLVVIGADLVELKLGGPPRLTPTDETPPSSASPAQETPAASSDASDPSD